MDRLELPYLLEDRQDRHLEPGRLCQVPSPERLGLGLEFGQLGLATVQVDREVGCEALGRVQGAQLLMRNPHNGGDLVKQGGPRQPPSATASRPRATAE